MQFAGVYEAVTASHATSAEFHQRHAGVFAPSDDDMVPIRAMRAADDAMPRQHRRLVEHRREVLVHDAFFRSRHLRARSASFART